MTYEFDNKPVDVGQLSEQVAPLNLPDFTGVARLHRRPNAEGVWEPAPPYILVKVGKLTAAKKRSLDQVIADHVPVAELPLKTELDVLKERVTALEVG